MDSNTFSPKWPTVLPGLPALIQWIINPTCSVIDVFLVVFSWRTRIKAVQFSQPEFQFSSIQSFSCVCFFAAHGLQHARLPCQSPTPGAYSNTCPSSWWCHPTISFSVVPFSSCLQFSPALGSFPMNQFFASGGQSSGVSATASVLPMNIQNRFPLGWTGWSSFQSKGLLRVFSNTTVQKHQFFNGQPSLWSNSRHWKNHSYD